MERSDFLGVFELSMILMDLGNIFFCAVSNTCNLVVVFT